MAAMKAMIAIVLVVGIVGAATAYDLGNRGPVKPIGTYPENVPDPGRQGGDTIATAFLIPSLPYYDSGTTAGYTNDYDEVCPYSGSFSPDVVYRYVANYSGMITVDLCGSSYDTKVYIYDGSLNLLVCNDDYYSGGYCGVYTSKIESWSVAAGTYYIIVDGYGGAFGDYRLEVEPYFCCVIECPPDGLLEDEPPLINEYIDDWNGGCNNSPTYPFQHVAGALEGSTIPVGSSIFCGESGWYLSAGSQFRDTDWFTLTKGAVGNIEITADAEYASYIFELAGTCEGGATVVQQAVAGPSSPVTMSIAGAAGSTKWFWVGPTIFADPDGGQNTYDYVVWFTGLLPEIVTTEAASWGTIKALYE
jgi:hypothetical protein